MPVRKVKGGYKWGKTGKVFPSREDAVEQGRAVYASVYNKKGKKTLKKAVKKK